MTLAHLSDTHLGFKAYSATTPRGFNQREIDILESFEATLDAILARDPDIVIHSGDLFHSVRPSNVSVYRCFLALSKFQAARDGKPFILIGGNHDTPKLADAGNILLLFTAIPGIEVVAANATTIPLVDFDTEVLAIPHQSIHAKERIDMIPTREMKYSILTLHGCLAECKLPESDLSLEDTRHKRWTYVALGDYHVHNAFGPNVCYAGSTDFASSNIWEETRLPKCWVWFDTEVGKLEPVPIKTRPVIDLHPIDATGKVAEQIELEMATAHWPTAPLPIVRQVVRNLNPSVERQINPLTRAQLESRALRYHFAVYREAAIRVAPEREGQTRAQTLSTAWQDRIALIDAPGGISRQELEETGLRLLKEVEELETAEVEA